MHSLVKNLREEYMEVRRTNHSFPDDCERLSALSMVELWMEADEKPWNEEAWLVAQVVHHREKPKKQGQKTTSS